MSDDITHDNPTTTLPEVLDTDGAIVLTEEDLTRLSDGRTWHRASVIAEVQAYMQTMLLSAYEIGRRLLWAKAELEYGEFGPFLEECRFSRRQAYKYMQIAQFFLSHPHYLQPAADSTLRNILLLSTVRNEDLEQLYSDSLVPSDDPDAPETKTVFDLSYTELKSRIAKLEAEVHSLEEECDDLTTELAKTDERIQLEREAVSKVNLQLLDERQRREKAEAMVGRETVDGEEDLLYQLDHLWAAWLKATRDMGPLMDRCAYAFHSLSEEGKAKVLATISHMHAWTGVERARFDELTDSALSARLDLWSPPDEYTPPTTLPGGGSREFPGPERVTPSMYERRRLKEEHFVEHVVKPAGLDSNVVHLSGSPTATEGETH